MLVEKGYEDYNVVNLYKKPTQPVEILKRNKIDTLDQLEFIPYQQQEINYDYPNINYQATESTEFYNPERVVGSEYNQNPDASYGKFQKRKSDFYDKKLQEMNKKQYGGATQTNFKSRLNPNADINIGAETEQQFYQPYTNKMRLFPNIQLDPVARQYDSLPMGANSMNYQAPNAESKRMFEGKSSNQLLDLGNYADRFGVEHFGLNTTPVSNQTVDRKSKFQSFMDKYGKKSDLEFNPNTNQVAPYYNLMKASEPLANQYRANVDMRYAETPLLDPLPVLQELQNQQRLATQNVNTNSPTGQSFISNLNAKLQDKTVEALNDIQQKNQQIAAQNEQARINAYNQEQQLNIAANQQYLQNQMQAQAAKDLAMGEALSTVDQMQANKVKEKNYYNSLAVMTPGLKKNNSFSNIITGTQGYDVDRDFQKLYNAMTQAKTPEEIAAIQKAHQDAINKQKAAVTKQIGGSINQFLKRK